MNIYLIRHAEAVELGVGGARLDRERALTAAGRAHAAALATALPRRGVTIERLYVSPLVRTRQTAEPLVAAWGLAGGQVEICAELAPGGGIKALANRLRDQPASSSALVGHRPDLNDFAAWLIGSKKARLWLDKGSVALIRVDDDEICKGAGELIWLLPPEWV